MKLHKLTNQNIVIKGKPLKDIEWQPFISELPIPSKVLFITKGLENYSIKKISWDFGDKTKINTFTNRKEPPEHLEVQHIFRQKNCQDLTTIYVCASVYTDNNQIYETQHYLIEPCTKKGNNYIDPENFKNQILSYYDSNDLTDELAMSVMQIANRLSYASNFINYTYREEMVGDALIKMLEAVRQKKFDPEKGNPFSYFTKIAYHAFCNRIKKEKKMRDALNQYQEHIFDKLSNEGILNQSSNIKPSDENDM